MLTSKKILLKFENYYWNNRSFRLKVKTACACCGFQESQKYSDLVISGNEWGEIKRGMSWSKKYLYDEYNSKELGLLGLPEFVQFGFVKLGLQEVIKDIEEALQSFVRADLKFKIEKAKNNSNDFFDFRDLILSKTKRSLRFEVTEFLGGTITSKFYKKNFYKKNESDYFDKIRLSGSDFSLYL